MRTSAVAVMALTAVSVWGGYNHFHSDVHSPKATAAVPATTAVIDPVQAPSQNSAQSPGVTSKTNTRPKSVVNAPIQTAPRSAPTTVVPKVSTTTQQLTTTTTQLTNSWYCVLHAETPRANYGSVEQRSSITNGLSQPIGRFGWTINGPGGTTSSGSVGSDFNPSTSVYAFNYRVPDAPGSYTLTVHFDVTHGPTCSTSFSR